MGTVTVSVGWTMLQFESLESHTAGVATLKILNRTLALAGLVTVQLCEPSFAVLAKAVSENVAPPLRETSILTFPATPLDVH